MPTEPLYRFALGVGLVGVVLIICGVLIMSVALLAKALT